MFVNQPYRGCEGDNVTICLKLAGMNWFMLEVDLTVTLETSGSKFQYNFN